MRRLSILLVGAVAVAGLVASACGDESGTAVAGNGTNPVQGADAGAPQPLESAAPAIIAPDKRVDASSSPLVYDAARVGVWTANGDVGSVSLVDPFARTILAEIAIGGDIRSVALSPDGKWVAAVDRDGARVAFIDADARMVKGTIATGTHPRAAAWDSANPRYLYVAVEDDGALAILDRTSATTVTTIPVGRLPAGVAVSRSRREVYVTHRIDGKVTVVDLGQRAVSADIALADQPSDPAATTPQGKPFGFESLALTPDGGKAWVPHELLANHHPFQFQRNLFPAVSVVDLVGRAEVVTNPQDPNNATAGRKVLFDAINILDPNGNAFIMSQPCAAALHPKGLLAYVVACASEDLMVFDVPSGQEVDLVRNLPGDHPIGIALDDQAKLAFVLGDQSKTLTVLDLADGTPITHVSVKGAPIPTIAKDSIDPELRAGKKLFFSANSSKGALASTGNFWMSCAGCHLDGFVSTNQFFFEALAPANAAAEARIGHVGLKDSFSTAPSFADASFDPHDVLVAFLDQGGLAPDRSGHTRDGAIDPSKPSPDAVTMAKRIARVIAQDLPVGPSWLLGKGDKPNADYDGAWCGNCHKAEYAAWSKSLHAHAADDDMVQFCARTEKGVQGQPFTKLCAGCHDPVSVRLGDTTMTSKRGITCLGCHDTERMIHAGGNADLEQRTHDWTQDHKARALAGIEKLKTPQFCAGCHEQFVPATGVLGIGTYAEWAAGPYAAQGTTCVDCHMTKTNGIADHHFVGGNVYAAEKLGIDELSTANKQNLKGAMTITASRVGGGVMVFVKNRGSGHAFPTGVSDVREPWVEVQAVDASGKPVARYGGPDSTGALPASAARLGLDIAQEDGSLLLRHELSLAARVPFNRRVAPGTSEAMLVAAPSALPAGAVRFEAVLYYRNIRTSYYRLATGDNAGAAPDVEVARIEVK